MSALTKIQAELKAPKNQFNSFGKYNYRSCEDILEAVKPLLVKHNASLAISDSVYEIAGIPYVEATVKFEAEGVAVAVTAQAGIDQNRKGMDIAQCFGASSSYARKYALNGLFLIDDTKDPDSTNQHDTKQSAKPQQQANEPDKWLNATDKQGRLLPIGEKTAEKLANGTTTWNEIRKHFKVSKADQEAVQAYAQEIISSGEGVFK